MGRLANKVAYITGAGSGIGRAVAMAFAREGASIVALDRSADRLEDLATRLPGQVECVCGDVRDWQAHASAVSRAVERFCGLDIYVGNAGVWDAKRRLESLSPADLDRAFDEVFSINVKGYLLGAKAAAAELVRRRGSMVFTLSTSSYYAGGGGPLYVAAKHACLGLVKALAHEFAPHVRVNGVAPAGTLTPMADTEAVARPQAVQTSSSVSMGRRNALGIEIVPEDHASAYVLLASNEARAMTGTIIHSDGGRSIMDVAPSI